jgi:ribonuclease P protein component
VASPQWLTRAAEFEAVRREGKRVRTSALEIRTIASLRRPGRVGLIVPRHQHSAVDRNRLKRRLREIVRRAWAEPTTPRDIVVRATPAAYRASFAALRADIARLAERLDESAS